ncbi:MAG TPA: gamma-glutamyl-gamma-aminobutyrate hydrolase family protein [Caulobacteraceae bacterium]|nr:gamma-glutamyl-gamma-aminobutyrate hydrolase family protein [Caulobacteraceae bacterium]
MTRPVLGVICCTRTVGIEPAQAVMNRYVVAAMRWGDVAALLVPSLPDLMSAREVAPRLDGLLLTGSPSNVEPKRYGQADAADAEGPFDPGRDAMTAGLIEAMLEAGRPVFGVCRGLQELNVAFGGALRRDMGRSAELLAHHAPDGVGFEGMFEHEHEVMLTPGGALQQGLGHDRLRVNSVHYQGIDRLGANLVVEARAPDGVVEGVSAEVNGAPVLAVQWHPEWRTQDNPDSQAFFRLLGRALRGEPIIPKPAADARTTP